MTGQGIFTMQLANIQTLTDWDNFRAAIKTALQSLPNAKLIAGTDANGNATVTITYDSSTVGQTITIIIGHQFTQVSKVI